MSEDKVMPDYSNYTKEDLVNLIDAQDNTLKSVIKERDSLEDKVKDLQESLAHEQHLLGIERELSSMYKEQIEIYKKTIDGLKYGHTALMRSLIQATKELVAYEEEMFEKKGIMIHEL